MTPAIAVAAVRAGRSKFDTSILGAFIKMMASIRRLDVQLTDDRYALVVAVNVAPAQPNVLVHDAATPREEALVLDLEAASGLGIRRSVRHGQLPPTALSYLAPNARVAYFFEPSLAADVVE